MRDAIDPADPLFTAVGTLRDVSGNDRASTHAATVDDLVEEWDGDAESYRLGTLE